MPKITDPALLSQLEGGASPEFDSAGMRSLGGGFKQDQQGRKFREGPRGGFSKVGGPTDGQIDDTSKALTGASTALAGIDRVDEQLQKTRTIGPFGWITNPTDLAVLTQSVKDLQLRLKEQPYNLGVLNGPDLGLLESIVANPDQLKSAAFRKTIAPRLANLASIVGQGYRSEADRYKSLGGNPEILPPLFQSPRSKYTKEEWGTRGQRKEGAPQNAFAPPAQSGGKAPVRVNTPEEAKRLPPGTVFVTPDGRQKVR